MDSSKKQVFFEKLNKVGNVFSCIFFLSLGFMLLLLIWGIWSSLLDGSYFSLSLFKTDMGLLGISKVDGGLCMQYAADVLNPSAAQHVKEAYLINFWASYFSNFCIVYIIWGIKKIFQNTKKHGSPFQKENSSILTTMGIAVLSYSIIREFILPLICQLFGIGGGNLILINPISLIIAAVFVGLSYIFSYGTLLQVESNETL